MNLSFFTYGYTNVQSPFVEKTIFSVALPLHLCQKSVTLINVGLFLDSLVYSIDQFVYPSDNIMLYYANTIALL